MKKTSFLSFPASHSPLATSLVCGALLLSSCTTNIEQPPPPPVYSSSSTEVPSSSSSLPSGTVLCLFNGVCTPIAIETCAMIGEEVQSCPESSSSNNLPSSSSTQQPSSSSAMPSGSSSSSGESSSSSNLPSSSSTQQPSSSSAMPSSSSSSSGGSDYGIACGGYYCDWPTEGCYEIRTDPEGLYGVANTSCTIAISNCDNYGNGRYSNSSCEGSSTRCKNSQGYELFCEWGTKPGYPSDNPGCFAIDPTYSEPPGGACSFLVSECNSYGTLYYSEIPNSTAGGAGKRCNGTNI